jgi:multiple antibiotic resistance protein
VAVAASSRYPSLADHLALTATVLAMVPVVAMTFLAAGPVAGRLRPNAMEGLARVSGIVLVALAIQLLVDGLAGPIAVTPFGAALLH